MPESLLRCRGLVDGTPRMEGAHLKTIEKYPTELSPDSCHADVLVRPHCG
ncbi:UNVERIFIED_CONTAM: hypothetical protein FKN15_069586 [Acipenser sinensis]